MVELFANSGDPDERLCSAASDLDLHCLPVTFKGLQSSVDDIPKEKWLNYLQTVEILIRLDVLRCLIWVALFASYSTCLGVSSLQWIREKVVRKIDQLDMTLIVLPEPLNSNPTNQDSEQTPHFVVSNLGLHCLFRPVCKNT